MFLILAIYLKTSWPTWFLDFSSHIGVSKPNMFIHKRQKYKANRSELVSESLLQMSQKYF